jgi:hypothetical protein
MSIFKILSVLLISTLGLAAFQAQPSYANDNESKIIIEHGQVLSEHDKYPEAEDYDSESLDDSDDHEVEDNDYDPGEHNPFPDEFKHDDHDAK